MVPAIARDPAALRHRRRGMSWAGRQGGFTLVELLVVVAILVLLASMLLPSLRTAAEAARRVECQANLHTVSSAALQAYMADQGPYILYNWVRLSPHGSDPAGDATCPVAYNGAWNNGYVDYLPPGNKWGARRSNFGGAYACPEVQKHNPTRSGHGYTSTYGFRGSGVWRGPGDPRAKWSKPLANVQSLPTDLGDIVALMDGPIADGQPSLWYSALVPGGDPAKDLTARAIHGHRANVLYFDGAVQDFSDLETVPGTIDVWQGRRW